MYKGLSCIFAFALFVKGRNFIFIGFSRCKQSLRQLLEKREERLRLPKALTHLRDLATAVDELHAAGYAHNDLHAGNVLFTDAGELKVADLQLSMRTGSDADNTQLTMNGGALNMKNRAPEVQRFALLPKFRQEQTQLTSAVDIFSIGVIGMQLLTGDAALEVQLRAPPALPAPRVGRGSARQPTQRGPPVPDLGALAALKLPPHVEAEAMALLLACLADNPKERPSAADVCAHPLFWYDADFATAMRRLYELEQMRPGVGPRDKEAMLRGWLDKAGLGDALPELAAWQTTVHPDLLRYLTQPRGSFKGADYGPGLEQLLRFARNSQEHPPDASVLPAAFRPAESSKEACRTAVQRYLRATCGRAWLSPCTAVCASTTARSECGTHS